MKIERSMEEFCQRVLRLLINRKIDFLVGGYFALRDYTGVQRDTKDLDLLVRPSDVAALLEVCRSAGYQAELVFTHWLGKIRCGDCFIDVIFSSGNGICVVEDAWFVRSATCVILDTPVRIAPLEEIIWQKAYIMERERFDGADIAHLLLKCSQRIDWQYLLRRFGPDWRVLLSHLVLFGFIYPSMRNAIPRALMDELLRRVASEQSSAAPRTTVCNGTLLSRRHFISDVESNGLFDARLAGRSAMTSNEVKEWTQAGVREAGFE
ncbi:MAG TPA: hypothetical protein VE860_22725 [Chthoniobacterales bacterium]|nr:hypothetical protein [Chthoniobacterales bacterium]